MGSNNIELHVVVIITYFESAGKPARPGDQDMGMVELGSDLDLAQKTGYMRIIVNPRRSAAIGSYISSNSAVKCRR